MSKARNDQFLADWAAGDGLEVLSFELDGERFALEATLVREIVDLLPETAVPGAPAIVDSVINFRGRVIPLADLRVAFGMQPAAATIDSRIVVIEIPVQDEPTLIGLRTDKVHEVTSLAYADSEPAPSVGIRWRTQYIRRISQKDGLLVILPDLAEILSTQSDSPASAAARH